MKTPSPRNVGRVPHSRLAATLIALLAIAIPFAALPGVAGAKRFTGTNGANRVTGTNARTERAAATASTVARAPTCCSAG